MHRYLILAAFVVLVLGGGMLIGFMTRPGAWYLALQKPSFNPPGWVFGPAWWTLYVLIAIAGWRTFLRARNGVAMAAWFTQLALNFIWAPVFFVAQRIDLALVIIVALLTTILFFIVKSWPQDRLAAALFLPYAAWVTFATILNAAIWHLNP